MLIADVDGQRTPAFPQGRGCCEICGSTVIAKCGQIVSWHWAHETLEDCDEWAEPISEWHVRWQSYFPLECREVVVGDHRADVLLRTDKYARDRVIELQHSGIGVDQIREREEHYGNMIWVFDAIEASSTGRIDIRIKDWKIADGLAACTFRWRSPRKTVFFCRKPVFLDIGDDKILHVRRIYHDRHCGGWGTIYPVSQFLTECKAISSLQILPEDTEQPGAKIERDAILARMAVAREKLGEQREADLGQAYAENASRYARPDYDEMVAQFGCSEVERRKLPGPVDVDPWRLKACETCGAVLSSPSQLIPECAECRLIRRNTREGDPVIDDVTHNQAIANVANVLGIARVVDR